MRSDPAVGWVAGRQTRPPLLVLVAVNLGAVVGVAATAVVGRPRFFGMALLLGAAVLVVDTLVLFPAELGRSDRPTWEAHGTSRSDLWAVLTDRRTLLATLATSLAVLGLDGRGVAYLVTVSAFFGGVFLRVATASYDDRGLPGDLWLFAAGSSTVAAAQTLTVAYFARTFDAIFHTTLARRIATYGTLEVVRPGRYQHILLSHTHMSLGLRLTGLDPRTYTAVFFAVLLPALLVPLFAVFRNVTGSTRIGLFGVGLTAINPSFLEWAMHVHAQSINFAVLVTLLVLLTKWRPDVRVTLLTGVAALAAATTHHLSTAMIVALVTVPVGLVTVWDLLARLGIGLRSTFVRYAVFVITAVSYWAWTGLFGTVENWLSDTSPQASSDLPTKQFVIRRYDDPGSLLDATVPFLLNNAHYVVFLALAGVVMAALVSDHDVPGRVWFVAAVFVGAVVFYVPNPVWVPLRGWAVLNRWDIMTVPFLLLPAVGLGVLTRRSGDSRHLLTGGIVALLIVTSVGAGFSDPSLADLSGNEKGAQRYFTEGHLAAASFAADERDTADEPVYGPTLFPGYLQCATWTDEGTDEPRGFGFLEARNGTLDVRGGLNVIPVESLREKKIKVQLVNPPVYEQSVVVRAPVSSERAAWNATDRSVVYDNGGTVVAYAPTTDPGAGGVECK